MFCFVLFFNVSNSIKNVIWLLTVEDPMDVFFFSLAIALKMQYGCWQLKILWLTVLAHGVGIKINGIFCYFLSFNLFFFFCLLHTNHTCFISSSVAEKKSPTCISLWNEISNYEGATLWCFCMAEAKYPTLTKARKKAEQANCLIRA